MAFRVLSLAIVLLTANGLNFTVTGFSSGAFFAHQLHVAYSQSITGAAIIAGGPYYCAQGSIARTATACTINSFLLSPDTLIAFAIQSASAGLIDDVNNISNDRVYIFSGTLDTVVFPSVVQVTEQFYRNFIHNDYKITTNYNISAAHGFVTNLYGNPCWSDAPPDILNCGFDLAGDILAKLLGTLKPRTTQVGANLRSFDQSKYVDVWKAGMSNRGWVYLPAYCVSNPCPVHVVLHGCDQDYDKVGKVFVTQTGMNEWAESNDIIMIYPQTRFAKNNIYSCWDFWGYTGSNYPYKSGIQMQAVYSMAQNPPYVTWSS